MFKKKKKSQKKCNHCIHRTGVIFKGKAKHWNNCTKQPFTWKGRIEGKCCKCNKLFYKRYPTTIKPFPDDATEVKEINKYPISEDDGFW